MRSPALRSGETADRNLAATALGSDLAGQTTEERAVARKTISDTKAEKLAQLEALKAEIEQLETKEANRLGRLALKAGLGEVKIPDAELLAALQEVAGRFRQGSQKPAATPPAPAAADRAAAE